MDRRLLRVSTTGVLALLVALTCSLQIGCAGANPFLAAQFATTISDFRLGGGAPGPPADPSDPLPPPDTETVLNDVCTLAPGLRTIGVQLENESIHRVRFAITFAASAGPGGFVCEEEVQNYLSAGYGDAFPPGSANSFAIGCDTVTLISGTRILRMSFGIDQLPEEFLQPSPVDGPAPVPIQLRRRDNGLERVPLPEIIIFGNSDINFICVGNDLCSQRGFVYTGPLPATLPIGKSVEAIRIQGTVCQTGFGTAPEWRLDKTLQDGITQPFQYTVGGQINVTVLDRSGDSLADPRNQVVWTVLDSAGTTVHNPQP